METDTHLGIYTDKGGRPFNEDAYLAILLPDRPSGLVFLGGVADGVGGQVAGRAASSYAVKVLQEFFLRRSNQLTTKNLPELMRQIFYRINTNIYRKGASSEKYAGMGTTLTCMLASPTNVTIAHVGDTRAYIKRGKRIFQITRDHLMEDSAAEEVDERFALFEEEPVMIGRVLGVEPDVEVDIYRLDIEEGDTFILLSDGIYGYVEEKVMFDIIDSHEGLEEAAEEMSRVALENGATDNVTAVIWEAEGLEEPVAEPVKAEVLEEAEEKGREREKDTAAVAPAAEAPAAADIHKGRFAVSYASPFSSAGASSSIDDLERLLDVALDYELQETQREVDGMPEEFIPEQPEEFIPETFEGITGEAPEEEELAGEEEPVVEDEEEPEEEPVTEEEERVETQTATPAPFTIIKPAPEPATTGQPLSYGVEAPFEPVTPIEPVEAPFEPVTPIGPVEAPFEPAEDLSGTWTELSYTGTETLAETRTEASPAPPPAAQAYAGKLPTPVVREFEDATAESVRKGDGRGRKAMAIAAGVIALLVVAGALAFLFVVKGGGEGSAAKTGMAVPSLAGMNLSEARSVLENTGLECGEVREEINTDIEKGKVISTEPAAGEVCGGDGTVILLVSLGPLKPTQTRVLPNVMGMSQDEALAALQNAGFNVTSLTETNSDDVAAGYICIQDPAPDASYPEGTEVALVISVGPAAPQYVTCPTCGGAGKTSCPTCGGRGTVSSSTACSTCGGSGVTSTGFTCSTCGGSGRISSSGTCSRCGGTGKVTCSACGGRGQIPQ